MKLTAKYNNPDHQEGAAGNTDADKKKRAKKWYLQPIESNPAVYLPPSCGASIFFRSVDISIDGQSLMKDVEVGDLQFMYQTFNRVFSTYDQRQRLGQDTIITCSPDVSDMAVKSEKLKTAMQALQGVSWEHETVHFLHFGFDGVPLLSAPRNLALATLQEHWANDNLTLPPGELFSLIISLLSSPLEMPEFSLPFTQQARVWKSPCTRESPCTWAWSGLASLPAATSRDSRTAQIPSGTGWSSPFRPWVSAMRAQL